MVDVHPAPFPDHPLDRPRRVGPGGRQQWLDIENNTTPHQLTPPQFAQDVAIARQQRDRNGAMQPQANQSLLARFDARRALPLAEHPEPHRKVA